MKTPSFRGHFALLATSIALISTIGMLGCDSTAPDPRSDKLESVQVNLTTVPTSAQCIRITATPSSGSATVKTFTVTAGAASTNLQVGPLLQGSYTFTADAFNVACTSISGAGNWIADPVSGTIRAGVATTITMTFRKNNPVTVNANFVNNVQSLAMSSTSSFIVTDAGVLQTGHINGASIFTRANFSAFDSSSVPGNAVTAISATGSGACAIRLDGTVWCWGTSTYGELGPGIAIGGTASAPVQVTGLSGAKQIAAGQIHVCANATGSGGMGVYCWGNNSYGELGNGTLTSSQSPVWSMSGVTKHLAAGNTTTYATSPTGLIAAWGYNGYGQVGNGTTTNVTTPTTIAETSVQMVAGGSFHACSLHADGTVHCWGDNYDGQVGDGTTTTRLGPVQVSGLLAQQIVAGSYHTCALTTSGETKCWGNNYDGELGNGTNNVGLTPTATSLGTVTLTSLSSGPLSSSVCGVATTMAVYCWGFNYFGQLGDGTSNSEFLPVQAQLQ